MLWILTASAAPPTAGWAAHGDSPTPTPPAFTEMGWDIEHYRYDLQVDAEAKDVSGTATVTATRSGEGPFVLYADGLELGEITLNGEAVTPEIDGARLIFPEVGGDELTCVVSWTGGGAGWSGTPEEPYDVGFLWEDGYGYSKNEPDGARFWMPSFDEPRERATVEWHVRTAPDLVAVANGTPAEPTRDPDGTTWHYTFDKEIPTYLMALHVGPFARHVQSGQIEVWTWAAEDELGPAVDAFSNTDEMLAFMADLFGPYPFTHYGNVVTPFNSGAMENPTVVTFNREYVPENAEWINIHEIGHHWFGDLVTLQDWQHIWLNESFATYAELLWYEAQSGETVTYAELIQEEWRTSGEDFPISDPDTTFNRTVYSKGASVLHMLRWVMGDEAFFELLRTWLDRYAWQAATTEDFTSLAEEVHGADLDWFFDPWLHGTGAPRWTSTWGLQERQGVWQLDLNLEADADFPMPVELRLELVDGTAISEIGQVGGDPLRKTWCLDSAPATFQVDPDLWILTKERTEVLDNDAFDFTCPLPEDGDTADSGEDGDYAGGGCASPGGATALAALVALGLTRRRR